MKETYRHVKDNLSDGSTTVFDAGANQKDVPDTTIADRKHLLTRKRLDRSDDRIFDRFPNESRGYRQ
ncbi:MAG: hypothetical protein AB7S83_00685 [Candidatus Methanomethylophilaceae archaeon]